MFAGYLRDLSERRRAERACSGWLRSSSTPNDAIIARRARREVIAWNPGAERLYGYPAEEALGRHISFTVPPHLKEESAGLFGAADDGEAVQNHQTQRLRKDGTLVDVSLTLSPLRDRDGSLMGTAAIIRDITQQKREERRRRSSRKQCESSTAHSTSTSS